MNDKPLISVIIPAYNGDKTIGKAVFSVVKQRYGNLELILVDDASKDSTAKVVKDVINKSGFSGRFKLVKHEVNLGLSRTLNDGLQAAQGDFVLILHQDCELACEDWIEIALLFMEDKKVAVVTGYYGLADKEDETFVKWAFGVLRKQFHSRPPKVPLEEVTFSEGKCDLYRKELLLRIGGFPTNYRIAGEDLVVSYTLRRMGYKIIKCYELPVIQRFSGSAEAFIGNLKKEFIFGKAMGGVFLQFKFFIFNGLRSSKYSSSRSLHRFSQPVFTSFFVFFALISFILWWSIYLLAALMLIRCVYYTFRVFSELKVYSGFVKYPLIESLIIGLIGILTDFAYSLGFTYGIIKYLFKKRL